MKKVIITGGSDGVGLALSRLLIAQGVSVVCVSRHKPDLNVDFIQADLTKNEDVKNVISEIAEKHADMDVLIHCAGKFHYHKLEKTPAEVIDDVFSLNITSVMKLTIGLLPLLKQNKGDIVLLGSGTSLKAYTDQAAYVASKWAVRGFAQTLQLELAKDDVRVLSFYPGGIKTKMFAKGGHTDLDQSSYMDPEKIAESIVFSLSLPRGMEVSEIRINRKKP